MKGALAGTAAAAGALLAGRRVARFRPAQVDVPVADLDGLDAEAAATRLADLIAIPTVSSRAAAEIDADAFARFRDRLTELYPETHRALEREILGDGALL